MPFLRFSSSVVPRQSSMRVRRRDGVRANKCRSLPTFTIRRNPPETNSMLPSHPRGRTKAKRNGPAARRGGSASTRHKEPEQLGRPTLGPRSDRLGSLRHPHCQLEHKGSRGLGTRLALAHLLRVRVCLICVWGTCRAPLCFSSIAPLHTKVTKNRAVRLSSFVVIRALGFSNFTELHQVATRNYVTLP